MLTVREKEHWKERIRQLIDRKIAAIYATEPGMKKRIQREGRDLAVRALGIAELFDRAERLERERIKSEQEITECWIEMLAKLREVSREQLITDLGGYTAAINVAQHQVLRMLDEEEAITTAALLRRHPLGKEIVMLRAEQENLLDTVWLATSPKQIKDLWEVTNVLLDRKAGHLQDAAMRLEPTEE